jgi:hypothetical protein
MAVPQNAQAIWNYLTAAGLSDNAVAGIEGNIEQESGGSTSAGSMSDGYGLIQWTPGTEYASEGIDSGNQLENQLKAIVSYINNNGSIANINANSPSPTAAALYFSDTYERPLPATANNSNREQSATQVAQAASSGNWPTSTADSGSGSGSTGSGSTGSGVNANGWPTASAPCSVNPSTYGGCITNGFVGSAEAVLTAFHITPDTIRSGLERAGFMLVGVIAVIVGVRTMTSGSGSKNSNSNGAAAGGSGGGAGKAAGGVAEEGGEAAVTGAETVGEIGAAPLEIAAALCHFGVM